MQYLIINGSPRPQASNSGQIIENLSTGLLSSPTCTVETMHLRTEKERQKCADIVQNFSHVVLVFPLYTDAMPGIVMDFIEKLYPYCGKLKHTQIGFVVHSGFPETRHCLAVKKYLHRLPKLLGASDLGCISFGGSMTMDDARKETLIQIGQNLNQEHTLDQDCARALARFDQIPPYLVPLFKLVVKSKRMQSYWIDQLKKNKVYERRNDRPYA